MVKTYKTKLNITSKKVHQAMLKLAGAYRKLYNSAIDVQSYVLSHTHFSQEKLISGTKVLKVLKAVRKSVFPFLFKMDKGLMYSAAHAANKSFKRWFNTYSPESEFRFPKYKSKKKDDPSFKTNGNVKVFYDHINIPKLGKIKLFEKGYLPQGKKYSNITFSFDGKDWWISLEVKEDTASTALSNLKATVGFDGDFNVIANGEVIEDITLSERYDKAVKKQKKLVKKLKRQAIQNTINEGPTPKIRTSRNMMKTRKAIKRCSVRLNNIKSDFFCKTVSDVVRTKPISLLLTFKEEDLCFRDIVALKRSNKVHNLELFRKIKSRLEALGTTTNYAAA